MEITAIMMARVLAFIEVQELNPRGRAYYPEIAAALVKKFNFLVFPTKPEDFNEQTGILFADGKFAEGTIDRMQILTHGIVLDTRLTTDVSAKLLHETLQWATSALGLTYDPKMVKRQAFVSQLTFESTLKLDKLNPILERVGKLITSNLPDQSAQSFNFETTGVVLNIDATTTKLGPGLFTIERRAELPFTDNRYFSTAPISTDKHIAILHELEKALI
jgi:hypothetical protein